MSPLLLSYLAGQLGAGHCVGRRNFLQGSAALLPHGLSASLAAGIFAGYAPSAHALPERMLAFPRDHGAHPDFATEWWYITGYASAASNKGEPRDFGFQVTFFRKTIPATQGMASKFAAKHIVFAHAALTDVQGKKLYHDQRIARTGFGIAQASEATTDVKLRDWTLRRLVGYQADINAADFSLNLSFSPTQPLLLQGQLGLSRKGPDPAQASYYYSQPQLAVSGSVSLKGEKFTILADKTPARAWLDHEWSQALLHPDAVGWDWMGMNLFDGSAVTAFQLRKKDGSALWTGGSFRTPSSSGLQTFIAKPFEVQFSPQRRWTSPRTRAVYPTKWMVRTAADFYTIEAVIDAQELGTTSGSDTIYWEGLATCHDSNGKLVGRGYLEMTGYAAALRL